MGFYNIFEKLLKCCKVPASPEKTLLHWSYKMVGMKKVNLPDLKELHFINNVEEGRFSNR